MKINVVLEPSEEGVTPQLYRPFPDASVRATLAKKHSTIFKRPSNFLK